MRELHNAGACEIKDWATTERILEQLIRISIALARRQVAGRKIGSMTFHQEAHAARTSEYGVTRPSWSLLRTVRRDSFNGPLRDYYLDCYDGGGSGTSGSYTPTDEDRAATDWMFYQTPDDNWVELDFDVPDG